MEETYHGDPFGQHLGLKIVSMENGTAQISLSIEPHHLNAIRVVHGGALYSLIDHAMGAALFTKLNEGEICSTLEIKIHYLNPARKGVLQAKAEVIDRKRQIAVLMGEIRSGGALIAKAIGSFYIFLRGAQRLGPRAPLETMFATKKQDLSRDEEDEGKARKRTWKVR